MSSLAWRLATLVTISALGAACDERRTTSATTTASASAARTADVAPPSSSASAPVPARALDAARPKGVLVRATAQVHAAASRGSPVVGQLAPGDTVAIEEGTPLAGDGCASGWSRLAPLGFVCRDALAGDDARAALIAAERREGAVYPLSYGESLGTAAYAGVPTGEQAARAEPGLDTHLALLATARRAAMLGKEDEIPPGFRSVELTSPADPCPPALTKADGAPVPVPRGAGVAWLSECEAGERTWLVTPELGLVPRDRVARVPVSTTTGGDPAEGGRIAFAIGRARPRYRMVRYGFFQVATGVPSLAPQTFVRLTTQSHVAGGFTYLETTEDGLYVLSEHVTVFEPTPRPAGVGETDRWLDVSVKRGIVVAYEGDKPVRAVLASVGDRVPKGRLRVVTKSRTRTTTDTGRRREHLPHVQSLADVASLVGDPYAPPLGLPSPGTAVRLSPADAAWLFAWTLPAVPEGWSSRRSADGEGTPAFVRE